jgi:hypothetical protein
MLALCAATACASGGSNTPAAAPTRAGRTIEFDDMPGAQAMNLYEVVQRIHPDWLRARNSSSAGQRAGTVAGTDTEVQVYVDNAHAGNIESLKQMPVNGLVRIQYYNAAEAQQRFGSGNFNGVIQVVTTK